MSRDTLLVIDDSPLDLTIFREIFKHLFHVECFEESRPAIAYIHRNSERICAVLLDICLGHLSGTPGRRFSGPAAASGR